MLRVLQFIVGVLDTNCYLVYDETSKDAIVIDPGGEVEEIVHWIDKLGLIPRAIIATHGHFDHVLGVNKLKERYNIAFYMHKNDLEISRISMNWLRIWGLEPPQDAIEPDNLLYEDTQLVFGTITLRILWTPGHTPGSISIFIPSEKMLFSGDTLFAGTIGRTDLIGGSEKELIKSIKKIYSLIPIDSYVYPGHGPETTLKCELRANPFIEDALKVEDL